MFFKNEIKSLRYYAELAILASRQENAYAEQEKLLEAWLLDIPKFRKTYETCPEAPRKALLSFASRTDIPDTLLRWRCLFLAAILHRTPFTLDESLWHILSKNIQKMPDILQCFLLDILPELPESQQSAFMPWVIETLNNKQADTGFNHTVYHARATFLSIAARKERAILKARGWLRTFRKSLPKATPEFWKKMAQSPGKIGQLLGEKRLNKLINSLKNELSEKKPGAHGTQTLKNTLGLARCLEPKQPHTLEIYSFLTTYLQQKCWQLRELGLDFLLEPDELPLFLPLLETEDPYIRPLIWRILVDSCIHLKDKLIYLPSGKLAFTNLLLAELGAQRYDDFLFRQPTDLLIPLAALLPSLSDEELKNLRLRKFFKKHFSDQKSYQNRRYASVVLRCLVHALTPARLMTIGILPVLTKNLNNTIGSIRLATVEALISMSAYLSLEQRQKLGLVSAFVKAIVEDNYNWYTSPESKSKQRAFINTLTKDEKITMLRLFVNICTEPPHIIHPGPIECLVYCAHTLEHEDAPTLTLTELLRAKMKHEHDRVRSSVCNTLEVMAPMLSAKSLKALYPLAIESLGDSKPFVSGRALIALLVLAIQLEPRELRTSNIVSLIAEKLKTNNWTPDENFRTWNDVAHKLEEILTTTPQKSLEPFYPLISFLLRVEKSPLSFYHQQKLRIDAANHLPYQYWQALNITLLDGLNAYASLTRTAEAIDLSECPDFFLRVLSLVSYGPEAEREDSIDTIADALAILAKRMGEKARRALIPQNNWQATLPKDMLSYFKSMLFESRYYQVHQNAYLCLKKIGVVLSQQERQEYLGLFLDERLHSFDRNPQNAALEALPVFADAITDAHLDTWITRIEKCDAFAVECLESCLPKLGIAQTRRVQERVHALINSHHQDSVRYLALDIATSPILMQRPNALRFQRTSENPQALILQLLESWCLPKQQQELSKEETSSSQQLPDNMRLI